MTQMWFIKQDFESCTEVIFWFNLLIIQECYKPLLVETLRICSSTGRSPVYWHGSNLPCTLHLEANWAIFRAVRKTEVYTLTHINATKLLVCRITVSADTDTLASRVALLAHDSSSSERFEIILERFYNFCRKWQFIFFCHTHKGQFFYSIQRC